MKKCKGCDRELDKYAIICWYCDKVEEERRKQKKEEGEKLQQKTTKR